MFRAAAPCHGSASISAPLQSRDCKRNLTSSLRSKRASFSERPSPAARVDSLKSCGARLDAGRREPQQLQMSLAAAQLDAEGRRNVGLLCGRAVAAGDGRAGDAVLLERGTDRERAL